MKYNIRTTALHYLQKIVQRKSNPVALSSTIRDVELWLGELQAKRERNIARAIAAKREVIK